MTIIKSAIITINDEVNAVISGLWPGDAKELWEFYGIFIKGYFFNPLVKLGRWDGKVRFFSESGKTYINLLPEIIPVLKAKGYKLKLVDNRRYFNIDVPEIDNTYLSAWNDPDGNPYILGEHQVNAINAVNNNHGGIILAGTGAGKSIMAAALIKLYESTHKMKVIVIVPSQDLVTQTCEEIKQFDIDVGMYDGDHKDISKQHLVSTWQSLQNNQKIIALYDGVIVDECHGVKATILKDILNGPGASCRFRIGLTGTLPKEECDAMNVRMSLGNVVYEIPAIDLINSGWLAFLKLKMYQLTEDVTEQWLKYQETHPKEAAKLTYKKFKDQYFPDYAAEKAYLKTKESRNKFIAHLIIQAREIRGNCFVIVDTVPFGKKLAKLIPNSYFIYAKDGSDVRKEIYSLFKERDDMVVIATAGLVSTGLNIKRIFNLFLVDQSKSFIRIIQSIGRGLRKALDKDTVYVYDIYGDFKYAKSHSNDRKKYYKEQRYDYDVKVVDYEKIDI